MTDEEDDEHIKHVHLPHLVPQHLRFAVRSSDAMCFWSSMPGSSLAGRFYYCPCHALACIGQKNSVALFPSVVCIPVQREIRLQTKT